MNKQDREELVTYRISKARETLNEVNPLKGEPPTRGNQQPATSRTERTN